MTSGNSTIWRKIPMKYTMDMEIRNIRMPFRSLRPGWKNSESTMRCLRIISNHLMLKQAKTNNYDLIVRS